MPYARHDVVHWSKTWPQPTSCTLSCQPVILARLAMPQSDRQMDQQHNHEAPQHVCSRSTAILTPAVTTQQPGAPVASPHASNQAATHAQAASVRQWTQHTQSHSLTAFQNPPGGCSVGSACANNTSSAGRCPLQTTHTVFVNPHHHLATPMPHEWAKQLLPDAALSTPVHITQRSRVLNKVT